MTLFDKITDATAYIKGLIGEYQPKIGIILGSGLGSLEEMINAHLIIPYATIPHFPVSTVMGHKGQLIFGTIKGRQVMLMSGRFHYYEGYNMQEVTFPVRVMQALGIHTLIVSNAAGGTNVTFVAGDLMVINDHINLLPENPLRGTNDDRLGTRFPAMSDAYSITLIRLAHCIAAQQNITLKEGVYVGLQGPSFETKAEYKFIKLIGGDAVGMSTVPEVIVARHAGMEVFAISVIANIGIQDAPFTTTHQEVLEAVNEAAPKMAALITGMIENL